MEKKISFHIPQEIDDKFKKEIERIQRSISYSTGLLDNLKKDMDQETFDTW